MNILTFFRDRRAARASRLYNWRSRPLHGQTGSSSAAPFPICSDMTKLRAMSYRVAALHELGRRDEAEDLGTRTLNEDACAEDRINRRRENVRARE